MATREKKPVQISGLDFILIAVLATALFTAPSVRAEPILQLRYSEGPYYSGIPMEIQVHVTGLERSPDPICDSESPQGGALRLIGLVPNVTTQVTIVNGRTTRTESVKFVCRFSFTPSRPGLHNFAPFTVQQGPLTSTSAAHAIQVQKIESDPRVRIRLSLPKRKVFVGQRFTVGIEWWIDESLQERVQNYEIHSELFEAPDTFRFLPDQSPDRKQQTLEIMTDGGQLSLPATVEVRAVGDRRFLVVSAQRVVTPLRAGEFRLEPATLNLNEVTRWQRDLFGGRRPAASKRVFGRDSELKLVVEAPPKQGRPAGFVGAIGRGFSFDVAADRSVVQRGDPILLTFTLRGEGELANVRLPPMDHESALAPESFSLPDGEITGELVDDTKIFRVPVRVLDESVRQIPALSFPYFDPTLGRYQSAESRPIALSVRPAQIISAADVVAANSNDPGNEEPFPAGEGSHDQSGRGNGLNLSGANLAIELNHETMLHRPGLGESTRNASYLFSVALLAVAIAYRRKLNEDPEIRRNKLLYTAQRERMQVAATLPRREGLGELASALRELANLQPPSDTRAFEEFLAECDNVFYSPRADQEAAPESDPFQKAQQLADEIGRELARRAK